MEDLPAELNTSAWMEALWQDVAEETADKLACCEGHDFVAGSAVGKIIFVVEGHAVLVERNQAAIGDGNTVVYRDR